MHVSIRIKGHLDPGWQEWLEGLQIRHEPDGTTVIFGQLRDQAALYGILNKLNQLSLSLLALHSNEAMDHGPSSRKGTRKGDIVRVMKLTPFLLFDGNCAEAMAFYHTCFGGELTLMKVGDSPMKGQYPPEQHNKVVYARLLSGAIDLSATDWLHPTRTPKQGNTVSLYLSEATSTGLRELFEKLSQGADPTLLDPLRAMPFGSYGHLADQYGVHWFFQGEKQEEEV